MLWGTETILLVEDEDIVRRLARQALERHGYTVLEAHCPGEAVCLGEQYAGQISLLVTDVVMPEMGGQALTERLKPLRPEMKVLYVSGYTDDAIAHHGVPEPGIAFLAKPFSLVDLARSARGIGRAADGGVLLSRLTCFPFSVILFP